MFTRRTASYTLPRSSECILKNQNEAPPLYELHDSAFATKKSSTHLGVIYSIISSVCLMMTSVFAKKLTYISPSQLSMVRNLGVLMGNLPIAIYSSKNILGPRKYFWKLIVRSFLAATALYLNFLSYKLLPMAEAAIITSTVPSLVTVVARFYLKEPCGCVQIISILITMLGVLLSVRLPEVLQTKTTIVFTGDYIKGLASAFGCVFIWTITCIWLRQMNDVHFSVILLYLGFLGALENGTITAVTDSFETTRCDSWDTLQVILISVLGFIGHCFMTLAVQIDFVSIGCTCRAASDIVVGSIFQVAFFNSIPDFYTVGSGLLVCFAIVSLGLWKWLMTLPEESVYRKRMRCLLI